MKLVSMTIENFRRYKKKVEIQFNNLTAFVGINDIGKSTILEALDLFFNDGDGVIKKDNLDINIDNLSLGNNEIVISACFNDIPEKILIDTNVETTLEQEYMLNSKGELEIVRKWKGKNKSSIYIKANHPTNTNCTNLLSNKKQDLQKIIDKYNIPCTNKNVNSVMRIAIWHHFNQELDLQEIELDISKEDGKKIWDKLSNYLPIYSLFQSDRKNSDSDSEIQDPLKEAVKEFFKNDDIEIMLSQITNQVVDRLKGVSDRTLEKLREMDEDIARSLDPKIPSASELKWADVFKSLSITGDGNIPINKRGSGVKRLILLNFFRAQAEEKAANTNHVAVIYAIEEPETSQHSNNQIKIIHSLKEIAKSDNCQVIITTHSPNIVKELSFDDIWIVKKEGDSNIVRHVEPATLCYKSLNEVNYLAFDELSYEYHDELYAHLEIMGKINDFFDCLPKKTYIQQGRNNRKSTKTRSITLTEYIRHQIHHPENKLNTKFTMQELKESIENMRRFIIDNALYFSQDEQESDRHLS